MASSPWPKAPPPATTGPFNIVHAGEIFTGRSLVPVLRGGTAARGAPGAASDSRDQLWRTAGGGAGHAFAPGTSSASWKCEPRIPFGELFAELQRAHLLLAVVGEHMLYSTPYKVYDYMASGRPILAHRATRARRCST